VIRADLTRDGTIPIEYFFVMNGRSNEWKPNVGIAITHRHHDEAYGARCIEYLMRLGQSCRQGEMHVLAERYGWPGWGKLMTLSPPGEPTDGLPAESATAES
jgi:hypothetical protein